MKRIILIFIVMLLLFSLIVPAQLIRFNMTDSAIMIAPGNSAAVYCGYRYNKILWYFTVANINTSVAVTLQAKIGTAEWTNVWADSLVYTANGNYGLEWFGAALADSLRLRFLYEIGGTTATITHQASMVGGD